MEVETDEAVWKNFMMMMMTAMTTNIAYKTNGKSGCSVRSEITHSFRVGS
jgi:hypothetical protein